MIFSNRKLLFLFFLSSLITICIIPSIKSAVTHVSSITQFDELIKKELIVADFGASWCGPCRQMSSIVDALAKDMPSVHFLKIDIDTIPALATRYNITSIPTFLFFKQGIQVFRFTGARSKTVLQREISARLLG